MAPPVNSPKTESYQVQSQRSTPPTSVSPATGMGAAANQQFACTLCATTMAGRELESHYCAVHLDYFPYSCGHCGNYMTTEESVHLHAQRKGHLPVKV